MRYASMLACLIFALGAQAQEAPPSEAAKVSQAAKVVGFAQALRSGPPGGTFELLSAPPIARVRAGLLAEAPAASAEEPASAAGLFAGEKENRATLSLTSRSKSFLLTLSAPWNDNGNTDLASLDGLAGATRLDTTYRHLFGIEPGRFLDAAIGIGLNARFGYESFDFLDATATKQSERKGAWSTGAELAVNWSREAQPVGIFVLGYRHESAYENDEDSEGSVCTPLTATTQSCHQGFLAPPKRTQTDQASLEFRWGTGNFGVAPIVIRDFDEKVTGVELPLFLVHDEPSEGAAGPLTGGVKLGWRSDTDDITVGLFVGASLALGYK